MIAATLCMSGSVSSVGALVAFMCLITFLLVAVGLDHGQNQTFAHVFGYERGDQPR
jgi:hypothetical protein